MASLYAVLAVIRNVGSDRTFRPSMMTEILNVLGNLRAVGVGRFRHDCWKQYRSGCKSGWLCLPVQQIIRLQTSSPSRSHGLRIGQTRLADWKALRPQRSTELDHFAMPRAQAGDVQTISSAPHLAPGINAGACLTVSGQGAWAESRTLQKDKYE